MRLHTMAHAGVLWVCLTSLAIGEDVADIPSPRPRGWVTDLTGRLAAGTIAKINALVDEAAGSRGAELAVVAIRSTDGRVPRQFATELFNRWGIGDREADDGVLLFVALEDRKAEIVLGDGIDDVRRVRLAEGIMENTMLPHFRRGDPDQAMLQAARRCIVEILGVPVAGEGGPARSAVAPAPWAPGHKLLTGVAIAGASLLGVVGVCFGARRYVRLQPPACPGCGFPMTRLGGPAAAAHLTAVERSERRIGSVAHYVWSCEGCDQVSKRSYDALFMSFTRCPVCRARTWFTTKRTLHHATQNSTGLREITERCRHCDHAISREEVIPRLPVSSSTSSCSGGSSGSSSGFSGGSSSGGGASGGF